jgi:hypothetical protein
MTAAEEDGLDKEYDDEEEFNETGANDAVGETDSMAFFSV